MGIEELFDVTITEVDDGYDVDLVPKDHVVAVIENGYHNLSLKLRDAVLPRIGSRVKVGSKLVKVNDVSIDEAGHIFVLTDTGEQVRWA